MLSLRAQELSKCVANQLPKRKWWEWRHGLTPCDSFINNISILWKKTLFYLSNQVVQWENILHNFSQKALVIGLDFCRGPWVLHCSSEIDMSLHVALMTICPMHVFPLTQLDCISASLAVKLWPSSEIYVWQQSWPINFSKWSLPRRLSYVPAE